jgi:hypothetical protein
MNTLTRIKLTLVVLFILFTTSVCTSRPSDTSPSPTPKPPLTANLSEITGLVQVLKPIDGFFKDAFNGQGIEVNDQVLTHQDSRVRIDLSNGTMFRIGPFSSFILQEMEEKDEGPFTRLKLEIGKIWIILRGGAVDVETPSGLASVRGSYLYVEVIPETNETLITCLEGECVLGNEGGSVTLGAGETAMVVNAQDAPTQGKMDDEDVNEWLANNPEATLVVVPLTATPTSTKGTSGQEGENATATMTFTISPNATPTGTGTQCGPPGDWVIYMVKEGETLEGIGYLFRVTIADLRHANCMDDSTEVAAGMNLFVPNVPTSTPTNTPTITLTPKPTNTNTPKPSNTPKPTASKTPTNTGIPSDSNAVFFNISKPPEVITQCLNYYKTDVIDPDGIEYVKLYFGVNTDPLQGDYVVMEHTSGNSYEKYNFEISTANNVGTDTVYYRFAVVDGLGNFQYYPNLTASPYSYSDSLDCGNPSSIFSAHTGPGYPTPITITSMTECKNTYYINVEDDNGVDVVELYFSLDEGSSWDYIIMTPHAVDGSGNGTYELLDLSINTTSKTPPVIVKYKFKAKDGLGFWTLDDTLYYFTDTVNCGS